MGSLTFELKPTPPFRLDLTGWALKRRAHDTLYHWRADELVRAFVVDGKPVEVAIRQLGSTQKPRLQLVATAPRLVSTPDNKLEEKLGAMVGRMLGINTNLSGFYRAAANTGPLAPLAEHFRGLKPPRFPSIFEAFVNAVACQQLSLHVGILLLDRLVDRYGLPTRGSDCLTFPTPEALAALTPDDLMPLSFSRNKATYITQMAKMIVDGEVDLESLAELPDDLLLERLLLLKGVGRWSAQYMLLRGYGRLNTFPIDDSGARGRLIDYLSLPKDVSRKRLEEIVQSWNPYSGLLYFHLLLYNLEQRGHVA